mgnify:FL=1|jgi:hypothetical protein
MNNEIFLKNNSLSNENKKRIMKKKKKNEWNWGIGIEHEMHLFHEPLFKKTPIKDIILAPTEKRVFDLMNKLDKISDENKEFTSSNDIEKFLNAIPYEPTGRICNGQVVINYLPSILRKGESEKMPEIITTNPFACKNFKYYYDQLENKQNKFINLISKLQYSKRQIDKYGSFTTYPFGMTSYIKMPKNCASKYIFDKKKYTDYTGSYHVTITLPFTKKTSKKIFIDRHENFANQIQWIEPLLLTAFFSADDKCMGTTQKKVKGSFRVMRVGWGNFAGSDVRKFNKGIGRYSNIETYWRNGLIFNEIEKLRPCYPPSAPARRERGISTLSSNFRTFGSTDPKRPEHRESGSGMTKPNGIEIRIFDHFKLKHLPSLYSLLTYIAENSRNFKTKNYVYKNKSWIKAMHKIMEDGWCAILDDEYVDELRTNLNLKIKTKSKIAYDILLTLYKELYNKNKNGLYPKLLLTSKDRKNMKILPKINMESWQFGFLLLLNNNLKVLKNVNNIIKEIHNNGKKILIEDFIDIYNKYMSKKKWSDSLFNFLYFLKSIDIILIENNNDGSIKSIKNLKFKKIDTIMVNRLIIDNFGFQTKYKNILLNTLRSI